jgi:hypothetical protein
MAGTICLISNRRSRTGGGHQNSRAHGQEILRERLNPDSDPAAEAIVTGDFHNGPLSLVLPFGLSGVIGFIWFLVAGGRVLYLLLELGGDGVDFFAVAQQTVQGFEQLVHGVGLG